MSREAWGDEGNVPESGRDTAIYQELLGIRAKFGVWKTSNRNDFMNNEQFAKAEQVSNLMDDLLIEMASE